MKYSTKLSDTVHVMVLIAINQDRIRDKMQIVFQDPYSSLNPRIRIESTIKEPLKHSGRFHGKNGNRSRRYLDPRKL